MKNSHAFRISSLLAWRPSGVGDPCDPDSDDFDAWACAEAQAKVTPEAVQEQYRKECEQAGKYWNGKMCLEWNQLITQGQCEAQGGQWVDNGSDSFCIPKAETGLDKVTWGAPTTEVDGGGSGAPKPSAPAQPAPPAAPPLAQATTGASKTKLIVGGVVLAAVAGAAAFALTRKKK